MKNSDEVLVALMRDDLRPSGLDDDDAKHMRLRVLSTAETEKLTNKKFASYAIPYRNLDGADSGFERVRFIGKGAFDLKPPYRYWQPANTMPRLYLPPNGKSWAKIAKDPTVALDITEGEKKACAGAKRGLVVVGIGGVWSFRSKRACLSLIPDLDDSWVWLDRRVNLVFDSDVKNRTDLLAALHALAAELVKRGARVTLVELPAGPNGAKVGLDDYLLDHTAAEYAALPHREDARGRELWTLNTQYVVTHSPPGRILRIRDDALLSRYDFETETANRRIAAYNSAGRQVELHAGSEWLAWTHRHDVERLVYEPRRGDAPPAKANVYNAWRGWGVEPRAGDVAPWRTLIDEYLFNGAPERDVEWFERWLAYPLQHPGEKLLSAVLIISAKQGVGKNVMAEIIELIYGANYVLIEGDYLSGNFNSLLNKKQFAVGDEVFNNDHKSQIAQLKAIVTRRKITINTKFVPEYQADDRINWLMLSNDFDPMLLADHDRRWFVRVVPPTVVMPPNVGAKIMDWARTGGAAALFNYLLNLNLRGFRSSERAPNTADKRELAATSRLAPHEDFARDVVDNQALACVWPITPEHAAPPLAHRPPADPPWPPSELFELSVIETAYHERERARGGGASSRVTWRMLADALKRAGARYFMKIRLANGKTVNLWAVANAEAWHALASNERTGHAAGRAYMDAYIKTAYAEAARRSSCDAPGSTSVPLDHV